MSHKRRMWEEVSRLAAGLAEQGAFGAAEAGQLAEHIGRLAREQFRANALQEAALEQQQATLTTLQTTSARQEEIIAALHQNHRKDIDACASILLLDLKQRELLSRLEVGKAVMRMSGKYTKPFMLAVPKMPIVKGVITDEELKNKLDESMPLS